MRSVILVLLGAGAILLGGFQAARAEPVVTLTSLDGATQVTGELISFDGQSYLIRTSLGTIAVAASQVTCAGEGCPTAPTTAPTTGAPEPPDTADAAVPAAEGSTFAIRGSNIIGDGLMPILIEGYADMLEAELVRQVGAGENERVFRLTGADGNEIVAIEVGARGTATAVAALTDGGAALGLASRRIESAESDVPELAVALDEHILALDGLVVIVHPDNPVRALTLDQIAAIFAGRIASWAQLGGPDEAVNLYVPAEGSGTLDLFNAMVMAPRRLAVAETAERLEDHAELSDLVSIDPGGIGVTGVAFARASRMVAIRQLCGLVSQPTSFAMKAEEYPLARRLYVYDSGGPLPAHAKALLDFALSDDAQPLIAEAGFIDRDIEGQGLDVQGMRLANSLTSPEEFSLPLFKEMLSELIDAERLSITFRFTAGSSELEVRSQSEAERFARLLARGAYAGKQILLVGFTDSVGDFNVNRGLAERRAQSVLGTLQAAVGAGALGGVPILIQSYGELTPVGCNQTAEGRELNRRVEVWVRDRR